MLKDQNGKILSHGNLVKYNGEIYEILDSIEPEDELLPVMLILEPEGDGDLPTIEVADRLVVLCDED